MYHSYIYINTLVIISNAIGRLVICGGGEGFAPNPIGRPTSAQCGRGRLPSRRARPPILTASAVRASSSPPRRYLRPVASPIVPPSPPAAGPHPPRKEICHWNNSRSTHSAIAPYIIPRGSRAPSVRLAYPATTRRGVLHKQTSPLLLLLLLLRLRRRSRNSLLEITVGRQQLVPPGLRGLRCARRYVIFRRWYVIGEEDVINVTGVKFSERDMFSVTYSRGIHNS